MKKILTVAVICLIAACVYAQDNKAMIEKACLNYIEGFYEGQNEKWMIDQVLWEGPLKN